MDIISELLRRLGLKARTVDSAMSGFDRALANLLKGDL